MRNELIKYIKRKPTIRIIYIDDKGNVTKRLVRVITINSSTFTAYCYLRNSRRTFKFNNVPAVVPATERVAI